MSGQQLNTFEGHDEYAQAVFDHSQEMVFLTAPDGSILAANPAACRLLDRTEDEIRAVGRAGVVDLDSPELARMLDERARNGSARGVLTYVRRDGSRFLGDTVTSMFTDTDGHQRAVISVRDLSDEQLAERQLAESELVLDAIVNTTPDMIFAVDPVEFRVQWSNEAMRRYFRENRHLSLEDGMGIADVFEGSAEYESAWRGFFEAALRDGTFSTDYRSFLHDKVLQLTFRTMLRAGEPFSISVFARDITDVVMMQERLAESEAKYRSVVMSMAEGVVVQDAAGTIVETNPAALRIEGRSDRDMVGRTSDDAQWGAVHEDGTPFPGDEHPAMVTLRTGQQQLNVVMGLRRPSGERRWISVNSEPVFRPGHDRPDAVVSTFHDITDFKHARDEIAAHVALLEQSMRQTLRAVASMVELRDPYTSGHMVRVGLIARDIARRLGWDDDRCNSVELAGMVHDVGKIAVPAELLTKPTRLGPIEEKLVRSHVDWSYEILRHVAFPLPIATIVHQHHERLDGSGYPLGLAADEIMPEARVLAVADVLESMAAHRPYRPPLGVDTALREIAGHRGTLYDPDVVDALEQMLLAEQYHLPELGTDYPTLAATPPVMF